MRNFLQKLSNKHITMAGAGAAFILVGAIGLFTQGSPSETGKMKESDYVSASQTNAPKKKERDDLKKPKEQVPSFGGDPSPLEDVSPEKEGQPLDGISEDEVIEIDKVIQEEREKNPAATEWDRVSAEGSFGETLVVDGLYVTVDRISDDANGGSIRVEVENKSESPIDLMPIMFAVLNEDGAHPTVCLLYTSDAADDIALV